MSSEAKLPLQKYLKVLTNNGVPVKKAMQISGKLYKTHNTPAQLSSLTDLELTSLGMEKEDRKLILAALKKGGFRSPQQNTGPGPSSDSPLPPVSAAVTTVTTPKKKRKRTTEDVNELLPGPTDEAATYGSMEFNEVLDEENLRRRSAIINRAPIMTAWSMIVAERQGFKREEALSIASAYTEMNALAKGVSLGIYKDGKQKGIEANRGGTQPYVELMGRRALYQVQSNQWRALVNGTPAQPSVAFSYISRSLRQTTPYIIGAMRLLAESFAPAELNQKGWELYAEFRPVVSGWGERAEVKCDSILDLRKKGETRETVGCEQDGAPHRDEGESQEPPNKIRRIVSDNDESVDFLEGSEHPI
ncbi:hypothetical protein BDZ89DRAFT_1055989 [Hymenopellis radicata]|nr:hypothetical protein BDZ89DRAFT_1055989 [Hymenopellis radicata]